MAPRILLAVVLLLITACNQAKPTTERVNGRFAFYPVGVGGGILLDTATGDLWRVPEAANVAIPIGR